MTIILTDHDFSDRNHIAVRPSLVKKLGGDAVSAMMLERISFRCEWQPVDEKDGFKWWKVKLSELAEDTGLSLDQATRAMRKLVKPQIPGRPETALIIERQKNGHDRTKEYRVNVLTSQQAISPVATGDIAGCTQRNRRLQQADSPIPPTTKTESKTQTKRKTPPRASRSEVAAMVEEHFDEWYKTYPLRKGPGPARLAYQKALEKISAKDERVRSGQDTAVNILLAGARVYQNDLRVKSGYIKEPATWLKEERWDDEPTPAVKVAAARGEGVEFNGVVVSQRSADALKALQRVHEQDDIGSLFADWDAKNAPRELEGRPW
jgi:hypothetical protein